jgi:hypothetical protein
MNQNTVGKNELVKKHLMKGLKKESEVFIGYTQDDSIVYCEELPILDIPEETIKEICEKYEINCVGIQTKQLLKEGAYIGVFIEKDSFKIICTLKILDRRTNSDIKKMTAIIRNRIRDVREHLMYELQSAHA